MIITRKTGIASVLAFQVILVLHWMQGKNGLENKLVQNFHENVQQNGNRDYSSNTSTNKNQLNSRPTLARVDIAFAIAGFNQCGAMQLAETTNNLPQVFFGNDNNSNKASVRNDRHIENGNIDEFELNYRRRKGKDISRSAINSFKASNLLRSDSTLKTFAQYFPNTDLVVVIRHPILHFQSEYSFFYRNLEKKRVDLSPSSIDMSTSASNFLRKCRADMKSCPLIMHFHHWLARLALTPSESQEELALLGQHQLSQHKDWKGRLLLMQYEQLVDDNSTRRHAMERTYENFIKVTPHSYNSTSSPNLIDKKEHLFDICHTNHTKFRYDMIQDTEKAAAWIRDYLLKSGRVVIPNKDHFLNMLDTFSSDPCIVTMKQLAKTDGRLNSKIRDDLKGITRDSIREDSGLVDFAIGGFAKCGTTTLMKVTGATPQVYMGNINGKPAEVHDIRKGYIDKFEDRYKDHRSYFSDDGNRLFNGFKSPEILQSQDFLVNMLNLLPSIDLIISTRHPVLHFQSAYNYKYRFVNRTEHRLPEPIDLIGFCSHDCHHNCTPSVKNLNICTGNSYFHYGLSRLRLTALESENETELLDHHRLSTHPSWSGRLFLIEIGQISDTNSSRRDVWERDYEQFLGIDPNSFNISNQKRNARHDKIIDICDEAHRPVREVLLRAGSMASKWIREYLLGSERVVVANMEHFLALIEKWRYDPCET